MMETLALLANVVLIRPKLTRTSYLALIRNIVTLIPPNIVKLEPIVLDGTLNTQNHNNNII